MNSFQVALGCFLFRLIILCRAKDPCPAGESWRQAAQRVKRFLDELDLRWEGSRMLVIGHVATQLAFEHYLNGVPLEDLAEAEFNGRKGWEYLTQ